MKVASLILAAIVLAACSRAPEPETTPGAAADPAAGGEVAVRGGRILTESAGQFGVEMVVGPGDLSDQQATAVVPRVAGLVATPGMVSMRVGDTISLVEQLRVVAFDSSGTRLGRLLSYEMRLEPAAARLLAPMRVVADRPGTALMLVSYGRRRWTGRSDAPASVAIPITVTARD